MRFLSLSYRTVSVSDLVEAIFINYCPDSGKKNFICSMDADNLETILDKNVSKAELRNLRRNISKKILLADKDNETIRD